MFNASAVEVRPRIDEPVDPAIVRALRQFIAAYHDLQGTIRDFVLPNPEMRS